MPGTSERRPKEFLSAPLGVPALGVLPDLLGSGEEFQLYYELADKDAVSEIATSSPRSWRLVHRPVSS